MMKKEKRKLFFLLAGMAAFMVAFGGALYFFETRFPAEDVSAVDKGFLREEQEEEKKASGSIKLDGTQYEYFHEFETYLLLGIDESGTNGEDGTYRGGMADFLVLLIVDRTEDRYCFLPLNRDTMTEVTLLQEDGTGMATADIQLCTAHWYGKNPEQSCQNTVQAVSKLLGGISIDGYYALPMSSIPALNHAAGGVELTLMEDFTEMDPQMEKGKKMVLTDEQAYHYLHDRYGVGDEENTSRMQRQKQYMQALLRQMKDRLKEDPNLIQTLNQELGESAVTNITGKDMSRITKHLTEGANAGFFELEGKSDLGRALGDGIDHVEFYLDKSSLKATLTEIYRLEERD